MKLNTRSLTRAAIIAALYLLLTFALQAISFGAVQFRIAEALMLLPVLTVDAVPGLFIGCLLGNLLGGGVWYDVLLGSLATLLAAMAVRRLRNRPLLAAAMPTVFNGLIVGPIVYLAYVRAPGEAIQWALLYSSMATVALGEVVVCYVLGLPLLKVLRRLPAETWKA
ncbi:MAG: QueT transporter family protein [Aristaeellaceae bacterium]|nr:QueT transporter family protein [Eubacteriales bacterium]